MYTKKKKRQRFPHHELHLNMVLSAGVDTAVLNLCRTVTIKELSDAEMFRFIDNVEKGLLICGPVNYHI